MGTCIIIPAYNAAKTLRPVVEETLLAGLPVTVIDDGSSDGTATAITDLPVQLCRHPRNQGKGAALKTGFAWGLGRGYDGFVTLDADGQHDPSAIPALITAAREQELAIVLGSRQTQFAQMAGLRHRWNRFGAWCMKTRTGFDIDDSQSGFRYYAGSMLKALKLDGTGYDLEMEILLKAWRAGFRIGSIPVPARVADGRATSHFRPLRDTWRICFTFLRHM